jgi:outer membrane protein
MRPPDATGHNNHFEALKAMYSIRSTIAILIAGVLAVPGFSQTPEVTRGQSHGWFSWLGRDYLPHAAPRVSFEDSPRMEKLMRAGIIYLSLGDAIALALENNLDIENARFVNQLNDANVLRASAGTLLRNVSTNISSGPTSTTLGVLSSTALGSGGTSNVSSATNSLFSGLSVQLAGSTIPALDPILYVASQFAHSTTIETATNITGTNGLITQYSSATFGAQQALITGTTIQLAMTNQFNVTQNSPYNQFNPYSQGTLSFTVQQNLLQGFRPSVNSRAIRQARNNLRVGDLTFRNQVMATVYNVVGLYWDLVADIEGLKIKHRTLELNAKRYEDDRRRAQLGAVAPIDILQDEAEMKTSQQDVIAAQSQVDQQEMTLKSVLTRSGMDNLSVVTAHIVPTDHFEIPAQESVRPIQDLVTDALANRPDVEQSQISLENARLTTQGVKDALLPQLVAFVSASNSGVAGQLNALGAPGTLAGANPYFLGGYNTVLSQVFGRDFPNYSAGVSLTMTLRNRSARADLITDQLNYRQSQIQDHQLQNTIKLNVINTRVALANARAAYDTSVQARELQDRTTAGIRRRYELGTATILDVIIGQRDATTRELSEVDARNQYVHARVNMQNVLGTILKDYDINIDEARTGEVSRAPDMIPAVAPVGAPNGAAASGTAAVKR